MAKSMGLRWDKRTLNVPHSFGVTNLDAIETKRIEYLIAAAAINIANNDNYKDRHTKQTCRRPKR